MTAEQSLRVAERTLEICPYVRNDVEGQAIRFGSRRSAMPYFWQPKDCEMSGVLSAARAQLASVVETWDVIQGGKNAGNGDVGRGFGNFANSVRAFATAKQQTEGAGEA